MNEVRCPECVAAGERSTVRELMVARTLMAHYPFYDEDGKYHSHDPNSRADYFKCSRGHEFSIPITCWCGWPTSGPYAKASNQDSKLDPAEERGETQ